MPPAFPDRLSPWTYSWFDARHAIDPVNVLLMGADILKARALLDQAGLHEVGNVERLSGRQFFRHGDNIHEADLSVATGREWLGAGKRTHARLYQPPVDPEVGAYTACTAHIDEIPWRQDRCFLREAAATFTGARAEFERRLTAQGRPVRSIQTRTLGSIKQCDQRRTVVDGVVLLVDV